MRSQAGFSLIELLIVIAIILVITAMAIPNLLRSKMSANEASAVSSLRTIGSAETTYSVTYPQIGYADQLTKLAMPPAGQPVDSNHAGLLDWVLGCTSQPCRKSGYDFSILNVTGTPASAYTAVAIPAVVGSTGRRGFCASTIPALTYDPNGGSACTTPVE